MSTSSTDSLAAGKPDKSGLLIAWSATLTTLGLIFVALRVWVRFFGKRPHGWDDYWIIVAAATSIVSLSLHIPMVIHGYGKSIYTLSADDRIEALKYSNFSVLVNGFNMAALKISIGMALLRIEFGRSMNITIWTFIFISVVCNAMVLPGTLFLCKPMEAIWNKALPAGTYTCLPSSVNVAASYTQTAGNIVTDIFFSLGPLIYIRKMHINLSKHNRWALRGVFLLGLSATICAIAKCWELPKLATTTDPTWDGVNLTIWVRAEFNCGVIGACAPSLKSLFEMFLMKVVGLGTLKSSIPSRTPPSGSYHMSRMSRNGRRSYGHRIPDGDAAAGEQRGYFVSATGGTGLAGGDRIEEEDQEHILLEHARNADVDSDKQSGNLEQKDVGGKAGITKTVELQVHREDA